MKRKQMRKAMAILLSASITMTSVSWNQLLSAKASGIGEREAIEPEEATAEHAIEEEKSADATVFDLGGNRKMEVYYGRDVRFLSFCGETFLKISASPTMFGEAAYWLCTVSGISSKLNVFSAILAPMPFFP